METVKKYVLKPIKLWIFKISNHKTLQLLKTENIKSIKSKFSNTRESKKYFQYIFHIFSLEVLITVDSLSSFATFKARTLKNDIKILTCARVWRFYVNYVRFYAPVWILMSFRSFLEVQDWQIMLNLCVLIYEKLVGQFKENCGF